MSDDDRVRLEEQIRILAEENRCLRDAAIAFGRLAERLNGQLREERRRRDRRVAGARDTNPAESAHRR